MTIDLLLFLAVGIRIFSNPIANVLQKKLVNLNQPPLFVNFFSYLVLTVFSLLVLVGESITRLPWEYWLYSILGGVAGAFGNAFIIKALEKEDLSVLGPINAYKSIVGIIFAFILIGELPNVWGFLGVVLIIGGSYVVLSQDSEKFDWRIFKKPGIQYRLAALVLTGIQAVFDKKIIQSSNLSLAFVSWCVFGAVFSWMICRIYGIKTLGHLKKLGGVNVLRYLLLCASIALMTASTNFTFSRMPVGEALALFQISILVSVFLGYKVFNEGGLIRKLIGSAIMIAGSLFILLFK